MAAEWQLTVITAAATVLAALAGSWAGARLAINRLRTERGFDRRLDWYERIVSSIQELRSVIAVARRQPDSSDEEQVTLRWGGIPTTMNTLIQVASESVVYADARSIETLHAALLEWMQHAESVKQHGETRSEADRVHVANELDRLLGKALVAVGSEARAHLGLEELSERAKTAFERRGVLSAPASDVPDPPRSG